MKKACKEWKVRSKRSRRGKHKFRRDDVLSKIGPEQKKAVTFKMAPEVFIAASPARGRLVELDFAEGR